MKPSEALQTHPTELREIVTRHGALRPRVFGSAINGSDTDESDLDLLVDPTRQCPDLMNTSLNGTSLATKWTLPPFSRVGVIVITG